MKTTNESTLSSEHPKITIGIGEMAIAKDNGELVTYALGSCVSAILYSDKYRVGAMLHIALPDSKIDPDKSKDLPGYFADTAIEALVNKIKNIGLQVKDCKITLVGGAKVLSHEHTFDIGKRNYLSCKKALWKYNLRVHREDCGGEISRTARLDIDTGIITLQNGDRKWVV